MKLHEMKPAAGARKPRKRLGRGPGSGTGKTCGRGHKGQKSRSGGGKGPWFEGGQMPIYRRLRKRGFKNPFRVTFQAVNLDMLSSRFQDGDTVDPQSLKEKRLIRSTHKPVKILARGEIDKALTVKVDSVSTRAREAIEKAGGEVIVTGPVERKEEPSERAPTQAIERATEEPKAEESVEEPAEEPAEQVLEAKSEGASPEPMEETDVTSDSEPSEEPEPEETQDEDSGEQAEETPDQTSEEIKES